MSDAAYANLNTGEVLNGGKMKYVDGDTTGDHNMFKIISSSFFG